MTGRQAEYSDLPVCSDGVLLSPRQPAPPSSPSVIRDLAIAAATAGAPPAVKQGTGKEEPRGTSGEQDQVRLWWGYAVDTVGDWLWHTNSYRMESIPFLKKCVRGCGSIESMYLLDVS